MQMLELPLHVVRCAKTLFEESTIFASELPAKPDLDIAITWKTGRLSPLVSSRGNNEASIEAITRCIEGLAGAALLALAIHEILLR